MSKIYITWDFLPHEANREGLHSEIVKPLDSEKFICQMDIRNTAQI